MAVADDVLALRDRTLAELSAAHDYYTDTKHAWKIVHKYVAAGHKVRVRNTVTGTVTTQTHLANKAREYVAGQLAEATFQQFVAIFEHFFFDLLRLWLTAHPQSLGAKQLDFQTVLDAPDKEAVTVQVVNKELNEIAYKRPKDWFAYLEARVKLGCPSEDETGRLGEAKAARDVLAHNRGVANKTYLSKAGTHARVGDGEKIDVPEDYHREVWQLIRKVVTDVSNQVIAKTRPSS